MQILKVNSLVKLEIYQTILLSDIWDAGPVPYFIYSKFSDQSLARKLEWKTCMFIFVPANTAIHNIKDLQN